MKKKGFTLVELLAVVVLLAIIALVLIPVIGSIIEKVKMSAVRSNAKGLLEAGNIYYAAHMDTMESPVEFKIINGVQTGDDKLDFTGKVHTAYLMLFQDNKKAICVDDSVYVATKALDTEDITVEEGICTGEYDEDTQSYLASKTSGGSFADLSIKSVTNKNNLPNKGATNDIMVITNTKISGYYVSAYAPTAPKDGMVWVVETPRSIYYLESGNIRIGVSYAMQYENGTWNLKEAYVYNDNEWKLLYYVDLTDAGINLEGSNLGSIELVNTYEFTGEYKSFTATFSGYYTIELWGAQGGTYGSVRGGYGAYTKGDVYLNAGDTIYVYVGGTTEGINGGWNGGGRGVNGTYTGRGGGGSTDVRTTAGAWNDVDSLKSRIMVAAGGGGGVYYSGSYYGDGGDAGGLTGYISSRKVGYGNEYDGTGGMQAMGGYYNSDYRAYIGGFGYGSDSNPSPSSSHPASGGGSGWYGGGGASNIGGGGGGSSYISGHDGCSSVTIKKNDSSITHTGNPISETGYYFINTRMIDGKGYSWTSVKSGTVVNQPTHDGNGVQTGNIGNGYAKISLKEIKLIDNAAVKEELAKSVSYNFASSGLSYYEGKYQEWTAPVDGTYQIDAYGAQGGTYGSIRGGYGAHTKGNIYLTKGTKLYIYVGSTTNTITGGWNGGGNGVNGSYTGRGGGGATDIRLTSGAWDNFESLKSRIMVAGAGGGAVYYNGSYYGDGGDAGGLDGRISARKVGYGSEYDGTGGGQGSGGYLNSNSAYYVGTFGAGSNSNPSPSSSHPASGGGSGWYGGGGSNNIGGGGGGSSYISGHDGCDSIDISKSTTQSNMMHTGSPYHESGYFFSGTVMEDAYNAGHGYATIKFVSSSNTTSKPYNFSYHYSYSGSTLSAGRYQEFVAPMAGTYSFELWGAQGGTYGSVRGGYGGYTYGEIHLERGTKLYVYVGSTTNTNVAGWNGGGSGVNGSYTGRGGGGATDIRTKNTDNYGRWDEVHSLRSRIMVAAGGGGGVYYSGSYYGDGGDAGGLTGYISSRKVGYGSQYDGTGATQIAGGYYNSNANSFVGGFGYGSNSDPSPSSSHPASGGGSGWYGGGGASNIGGGGGGSSYVSGHEGCIAVTSSGSSKTQTYSQLSDSISHTGYKFANTSIVDGKGYAWTTEKANTISNMPNYFATSSMVGNTGNGHAKITYLGN